MWIVNYFNELKAWSIMRKVYKENKSDFEKVGLKSDWFGRLWKVINRDEKIPLGSKEDEELLTKEMNDISKVLIKNNVMDMLAYELIPLEDRNEKDSSFENSYLIKLTPAWNLEKQFVTMKSTLFLIILSLGAISGITYSVFKWLI